MYSLTTPVNVVISIETDYKISKSAFKAASAGPQNF